MVDQNRRELLTTAGAISVGGLAIAGCVSRLWNGGSTGDSTNGPDSNTTTEKSDRPTKPNRTDNTTNESQSGRSDANKTSESGGSENETDYPDPANPNTTDTTDETGAANSSEIAANQPTSEDIEIDDTDITTTEQSATVTGTLINTGEHTISTLELRVVFVNKSGREIGGSMWGTNDLGPGEEWDFKIVGRGEKYSKSEDYTFYPEIAS